MFIRSCNPPASLRPAVLLLLAALLGAVTQGADASFVLPPLPYNYSALEPIIDTQTMIFHHDTHHQSYITRLNAALVNQSSLSGLTLTQIIRRIGQPGKLNVSKTLETTLRRQGGGAWNHAFFWKIMAAPGSPETALPSATSNFTQAVTSSFGSLSNMTAAVNAAGAGVFGSGWTWLVYTREGRLQVVSSANQDVPLSGRVFSVPILGVDVWEHAYYLKYGPGRAAYLSAWWSVANWRQIEANYATAVASGFEAEKLKALIGDADRQV